MALTEETSMKLGLIFFGYILVLQLYVNQAMDIFRNYGGSLELKNTQMFQVKTSDIKLGNVFNLKFRILWPF